MHASRLFYQSRRTTGAIVVALFLFASVSAVFLCGGCAEPSLRAQSQDGSASQDSDNASAESTSSPSGRVNGKPDEAYPFARYAEAPPLVGGLGWINTGAADTDVDLKQLKGKFVILDFWTYCCINCMHVLPELAKLEARYPNNLVVIGVHSAKFEGEKDSKNIEEAVLRYNIKHPVVNDAEHKIWDSYAVNSWPSFRVIDPLGNLVAGQSGEVTAEVVSEFLDRHLPYYRERNLLDETPIVFELPIASQEKTPLRFPGKLLADEAGKRLFIADSNHHRIVICGLDGKLIDTVGSGKAGANDGDANTASFNQPQGMALVGEMLYVADTENHLIRVVDLETKQVATLAGTGEQGRGGWPSGGKEPFSGPRTTTPLNSPWDVWAHGGVLWIAMAGPHQIWKMPLDGETIGIHAGNGREDIVDGPLLPEQPYSEGYASFAQPSGLSSDGKQLFVADSEGSSIRAVPFDNGGTVSTVVGTSALPYNRLFTYGDRDGAFDQAVLQHALGAAWKDGALYVVDTYNDKLKKLDLASKQVSTLAGGGDVESDGLKAFDEPAGISIAGDHVYIADTNNHRVRVYSLKDGSLKTLVIEGLSAPRMGVRSERRLEQHQP